MLVPLKIKRVIAKLIREKHFITVTDARKYIFLSMKRINYKKNYQLKERY